MLSNAETGADDDCRSRRMEIGGVGEGAGTAARRVSKTLGKHMGAYVFR